MNLTDNNGNELRLAASGLNWVAFSLRPSSQGYKLGLGYVVSEGQGAGWGVVSWYGPNESYPDYTSLVDDCNL